MGYIAKYNIRERIGILSGDEDAYSKQVNLISWNGGTAKIDIRGWNPEGKPQKGIVLTEEEARNLQEVLEDYFSKEDRIK